MKNLELMTATLIDGSQVTGVEITQSIHGDEVVLFNDGQQMTIKMYDCVSYAKADELLEFDELTAAESIEIEKLINLSSFLIHQAY